MDGDRPSRRAHILSSINPLREPAQTISSHKQDPPPSRGRQHRAERTDEPDDDDDDDDDDAYAPAKPGKRHSKAERQQESPQLSDRGAADGAYSSSKPTKFRFKSEKRSRNRRYSMDDPLLLGVKSRSRRRSRAGEGEGEGDDAEGRSGRREQDPSQSQRRGGDEHHSSSSSHHHRRSRRRGDDDGDDDGGGRSSKRRRREHRDKTKKKRRKKTEEQEPEPEPEDPFAPPPLDADAAFRESLFDAMADDEGAAYWEGVYGQPIHTYGPPSDARGELEQMTSDEYADYVRRKMWEKSNPGLAEARDRRERERRARTEEADRSDGDDDHVFEARRRRRREKRLAEEMDRSLRRGQERKRLFAWTARWRRYVDAWAAGGLAVDGGGGAASSSPSSSSPPAASAAAGDAWPVESGKRADIAEGAVREFFARCADVDLDDDEDGAKAAADPRSRLKDERVRWHPDKVQQRLGGKVDEALMRDVTTVFQIVDKLWAETRAASRT